MTIPKGQGGDLTHNVFDCPQRARAVRPGTFQGGTVGVEQALASLTGMWSNCDFWVAARSFWRENATFVLYGLQGNVRAPIATVESGTIPADVVAVRGNREHYLCFSVRGHPCDGFEAVFVNDGGVWTPDGDEDIGAITLDEFYLQAWGDQSQPQGAAPMAVGGDNTFKGVNPMGPLAQVASYPQAWDPDLEQFNHLLVDSADDGDGGLVVHEGSWPTAFDSTVGVVKTVTPSLPAGTPYDLAIDQNLGTAETKTVVGAPAVVQGLVVSNQNAAVRYFQLHQAFAVVSGVTVPKFCVAVPPGQTIVLDHGFFFAAGLAFFTALTWAWSTTPGVYTTGTTPAEHLTSVVYAP